MHAAAFTVMLLLAALPSGIVRAADVAACNPALRSGVPVSERETDQHRLFEVPVVDYPRTATPEFDYRGVFELRVDERGHVACFVEPKNTARELTPERRAVLRRASAWRYRPFLRDGHAVAVIASQRFDEQILPQRHVPTPRVPDNQVRISFVQSRHFFGGTAYAVHIRGDGWVGFHALAGSDVPGTFGYRVPKEDVARLIALIRDGDLWSAAGNYHGQVTDQSTQWLTVRFGNETKTITDYAGRAAGMPVIVTRVQEEVARVARAEQWTTLSDAALDRLQRDRFDFRSPAAGQMLASAVLNHWARDDGPMLRLLELGAPIDAPLQGRSMIDRPASDSSLIEEALLQRRTRLIAPLIARGALNTKGRPDQRKIDAAFRAAVIGGRLQPVQQIWAVAGSRPHPALTYRDAPDFPEAPPKEGVPVALLLDRGYDNPDWEGLEIARWLDAQGNDLLATGANGRTLLETAAAGDVDGRFVRYLLEKGADPTVSGRYEYSPVDSAQSEDVALALLEAGSEVPNRSMGFPPYRDRAQERGWNRVVAWLDSHPSAPVMPLSEELRKSEESMKRAQERVRKSPCWQRWIADQARANAAAKAKGKRAELLPMNCFCGGDAVKERTAKADGEANAAATSGSCSADQ
jgi:hypothetical protein